MIDPTGDTIKFEVEGEIILWHNGALVNLNGTAYGGSKSGDVGIIAGALNQLFALESGKKFLTDLSESENNFMIELRIITDSFLAIQENLLQISQKYEIGQAMQICNPMVQEA